MNIMTSFILEGILLQNKEDYGADGIGNKSPPQAENILFIIRVLFVPNNVLGLGVTMSFVLGDILYQDKENYGADGI